MNQGFNITEWYFESVKFILFNLAESEKFICQNHLINFGYFHLPIFETLELCNYFL